MAGAARSGLCCPLISSRHEIAGARATIDAAGAWLRPFEYLFSKFQSAPRNAARSVQILWAAINRLIRDFGPVECTNDFDRAGCGRSELILLWRKLPRPIDVEH